MDSHTATAGHSLADTPILILSQDYELFFQESGTIEKCLFEPCDALLKFAADHGVKFTFFVDAGMLLAMQRYAKSRAKIAQTLSKVQRHIESLAAAGHEIALHVHPHWEDTRWIDGRWVFAGTRYQLQEFDGDDVIRIFRQYSESLAALSGQRPTSFRAGGFCVEPFSALAPALTEVGIAVDSSVVPGATLRDPDKGFDFASAPRWDWWRFDTTPVLAKTDGGFLEIPITPMRLPVFYYWSRLVDRVAGNIVSQKFGDGTSKAIGRAEVLRRLAGMNRIAELSIDDPKARHLLTDQNLQSTRGIWHLMGHPKLLSSRALKILEQFIGEMGIQRSETIAAVASLILSYERT